MGRPTLYTREMINEYTQKGYWDTMTNADLWDQRAADMPDKEAIVDRRRRFTWAQAGQWTDRFTLGLLELGFEKDEMIIIQLPNWMELVLCQVACEKAGVLCLPVPWALRHSEMAYIMNRVKPAGVVIPYIYHGFNYSHMMDDLLPKLSEPVRVFIAGEDAPEGTISINQIVAGPIEKAYPEDRLSKTRYGAFEYARVQLTTGSTGFPKFIEAPICGRLHCARSYVKASKLSNRDICGILTIGPGGPNFIGLQGSPLVGAKMVLLEHFDAKEALELIASEKITFLGVVPAMLAKIIEHPDFNGHDLSSLRMILSTGAPLPADIANRAEEMMGPIVQTYGSMDFGGITLPDIDSPRDIRLFTVNRLIPTNEFRFIDENGAEVIDGGVGELLVRGPTCTSGFYGDKEANRDIWTSDGWFRTGDLGKIDGRGNLIIVGRQKDVIIRGGQNIYPAEVENLLLHHPKIANVTIVAMPDDVLGEKACAYVVLKDGLHLDFEEMILFLKGQGIASYKLPERVEFIDRLPLLPGVPKVDKKALAKAIATKMSKEKKPLG